MALELLANNVIERPDFELEKEPSDFWVVSGWTAASPEWYRAKFEDAKGYPLGTTGIYMGILRSGATPKDSPHASLGILEAGSVLQIIVEVTAKSGAPITGSFMAGVVPLLTTANSASANFMDGDGDGATTIFSGQVIVQDTGFCWFRVSALGTSEMVLKRARVYLAADPDEYGYFSGDTADTETLIYSWRGTPNGSVSELHGTSTHEPEPEPEPEVKSLAVRVAHNIGRADEPEAIALAEEHVEIVMEYARGYTRGNGFKDDVPNRGISAVIVAAASKLTTNPEQLTSYTTGDYSERGAILNGWTLAQLAVLNRYRKRQS